MPSEKTNIKKFVLAAVLSIVFFNSLSPSSVSNQGFCVLLDGLSSAGKTTTAQNIQKKMAEQAKTTFKYEPHDKYISEKWAAEDASALTQTPKAQSDDDDNDDDEPSASLNKSSNTSNSDDNDYIKNYFLDKKDLTISGTNVILDLILMDEDERRDYLSIIGKGPKTVCVMVHCPITEIASRVQARNQSGDENNQRSLYQAIAQIPDMFEKTRHRTDQTIDTLTKQEIETLLIPLKKELEEDNKERRAKGKKEDNVKKTLRNLRRDLSPKKGDITYFQPKMQHDIVVINSGKNGAESAAQKITDYMLKRMDIKKPAPIHPNHIKITPNYTGARP